MGTVTEGEPFCAIEAAKAVTEIEAPLNGEVIAFNDELLSTPENLNEEDDELNWLIEVSVKDFDKSNYLKEDLPFEE